MNIYFTASTSGGGEFQNHYRKILAQIKRNREVLISGKQTIDKGLLEEDSRLTPKEIFIRQKKLIDAADCIVAEVTKPSLGAGGEIVYALTQHKPVLALVYENFDDQISPMVEGNPSENLFLEYYNEGKLPYVIKDFFHYIKKLKRRRGTFIVIDGSDGSGKTTQANLLISYLKKKKIPVKYVDFPQYYSSFHGNTVAKFLRGEFGTIDQVSPYLASLAYALDRASIKAEMNDFLEKGGVIIANRYATSNMGHQGAKFSNEKDRSAFLKWVYELEYKVHKIPKEDVVIYLYVPWQMGMKLTEKKGDRGYLKGKEKDIHEKNIAHRIASENMYLSLAKKYNWIQIQCVEKNILFSPQEIHEKIITALRKRSLPV